MAEDQGKPLGRSARRQQRGGLDEDAPGGPAPSETVIAMKYLRSFAERHDIELPVEDDFEAGPDDLLTYMLYGAKTKALSDEPEPEQEQLKGLEILSSLIYDVDCNVLTMPQARRALGEWFHKQDRAKVAAPGRDRMRRLKQIADAMNEEMMSLLGSQP